MQTLPRRALPMLVAAIAALGPACTSAAGGKGDVQITLRDYDVELSKTSVPSRELTFAATNEGPSVHEFEIFSVPPEVDADALPVDGNVADTRAAGLELIEEAEDIAPSTGASVTVSLEPGTYAIICNLPAHYERGMHATFMVR